MFAIVGVEGTSRAYVPGMLREKRIRPIHKVLPLPPLEANAEKHKKPFSQFFSQSGQPVAEVYEAVDVVTQSVPTTLLAKDIMSAPVESLPSNVKFDQAKDVIYSRRFRHMPIVDGQDRVIGVLSDRDVLRALADPTAFNLSSPEHVHETVVQHFMSQPVLVAKPEVEIRTLVRVMFDEHIGAIPILSDAGQLVGIITRSDILRVLLSHPHFDQWI